MTVTDILHIVADGLLLVIVVLYDRQIERLKADCERHEAQLKTLQSKVETCCSDNS